MKMNRGMRLGVLLLAGKGLICTANCQDYYLSTVISGSVELGITDYGGSFPWPSSAIQLNFGTLTEQVYVDPVLQTVRQMGSVTVTPSASSIVLHETQQVGGQSVTGDLTIYQQLVGGSLGIDTGALPYVWDPSRQAFYIGESVPGGSRQPVNIGPIQVQGSYSLVTGGQTYTGLFSYSLSAKGIPAQTFSLFSNLSGTTSLSMDGLTSGPNGGVSVYSGGPIQGDSTLTAADGFQMTLGCGVSDGTDYFQWSSPPAVAVLVPEPAAIVFLGLGSLGFSLWRVHGKRSAEALKL